eukprot:CAMPEP_0118894804 /NCGR_PEP_ID=MMETSP1166-20130328/3429_1 /TAXON_ID=1104430 /ORGANISM="Chrysoreinhardia sp, Strain CCMP3193" /LENGTH=268 /DNA_ID=CAMNT_0006833761 /DNA_START=183 /DNA_END=989 /DNA_ORIENTATION=+
MPVAVCRRCTAGSAGASVDVPSTNVHASVVCPIAIPVVDSLAQTPQQTNVDAELASLRRELRTFAAAQQQQAVLMQAPPPPEDQEVHAQNAIGDEEEDEEDEEDDAERRLPRREDRPWLIFRPEDVSPLSLGSAQHLAHPAPSSAPLGTTVPPPAAPSSAPPATSPAPSSVPSAPSPAPSSAPPAPSPAPSSVPSAPSPAPSSTPPAPSPTLSSTGAVRGSQNTLGPPSDILAHFRDGHGGDGESTGDTADEAVETDTGGHAAHDDPE